jgi:hypothetical protein
VNYDDETLMAYADGELDAAQRAQIAAAVERDPGLARRVERQRALRVQVTDAFSAVLEQPVPERLTAAAVGGGSRAVAAPARTRGKVIQFPGPAPQVASTRWRAREWTAMAASLLVGILISWRVFAPGEEGVMVAGAGAIRARGELATALDAQLASAQRPGASVLIGLTFKARDGSYCRSFTLRATKTAGLACRVGSDWQIPATTTAEIPAGTVQQAATALPPAILQAVEARITGEPLDATGEEAARLAGWR